jgi:tetratricopeptide (TPR) repeat protein
MNHLWISCRYYAAGHWDMARQHLSEALTLCPELLERPENLSRRLGENALNPRVENPIQFVDHVFDHLPACADALRPYHRRTLSHVYLALALRNYGQGDIAQAQAQLAQTIALNPALLEQPATFFEHLTNSAMRLPLGDPLAYVDTVFQNLPPAAQDLHSIRPHVLGEVSIRCAFENYQADRSRQTIQDVLTALRYHPSWLGNRGVISILLRSLVTLPAEPQPSRPTSQHSEFGPRASRPPSQKR